jgi:hypothetical protein
VQKYQNSVTNNNGQSLANLSVLVTNFPAGTPATIYSDNGITPVANPLTTDQNGAFGFYAADGHYSLTVSGAGIVPVTVSDILLVDVLPADLPTTLPGSAGHLWNNDGAISVS